MANLHVVVLGVCLLTSPFIVLLAWWGIAVRYLDYLESVFSNSPMVIENKKVFSHASLPGKIMRVGAISAMLTMAKFSVRKGLLDSEDVAKLSYRLRQTLVTLLVFHVFLLAVLVIFCIWIRLWRN